jgi:hypothetical protein
VCMIARCRAEIAAIEAQIRAGHPDLQGLCRGLADWSCELRLLQGGGGSGTGAPSLATVRASQRVVAGIIKTYRNGKRADHGQSASGAGIATLAPRLAPVRSGGDDLACGPGRAVGPSGRGKDEAILVNQILPRQNDENGGNGDQGNRWPVLELLFPVQASAKYRTADLLLISKNRPAAAGAGRARKRRALTSISVDCVDLQGGQELALGSTRPNDVSLRAERLPSAVQTGRKVSFRGAQRRKNASGGCRAARTPALFRNHKTILHLYAMDGLWPISELS